MHLFLQLLSSVLFFLETLPLFVFFLGQIEHLSLIPQHPLNLNRYLIRLLRIASNFSVSCCMDSSGSFANWALACAAWSAAAFDGECLLPPVFLRWPEWPTIWFSDHYMCPFWKCCCFNTNPMAPHGRRLVTTLHQRSILLIFVGETRRYFAIS